MPTITVIGSSLVLLGMIFIAFTPKEKIIEVVPAKYGVTIAIVNATGDAAAGASVPFYEPGKILAWDADFGMYRWIPEPPKK